MRQFLVVTVLLALISLPAAFVLGGIPPSAVGTFNAVSAEGADKGAAVVAALQRVAAGLAASLAGTDEGGDPLRLTAPTAAEDDPAARFDLTPADAILVAAPSVLGAPDRFRRFGGGGSGGAAIALAAMNPGRPGLARDYPTAFLWFVLA
jgi:hypothetical protein